MYVKNHFRMSALYLHPNQETARISEVHCVPFSHTEPLPGPLFQPSAFCFIFNCPLDLCGGNTQTVKPEAAALPRALPPRAALRGSPPRLGFSLLQDPRLWTICGTSSSSKKGSPASSMAPVLAPMGGSGLEGSRLFLDSPVSYICVTRFVINRETFCSDLSWYFGLP